MSTYVRPTDHVNSLNIRSQIASSTLIRNLGFLGISPRLSVYNGIE